MQKGKYLLGVAVLVTTLSFVACTKDQPVAPADQLIRDGVKKMSQVTSYNFDGGLTANLQTEEAQKISKIDFTLKTTGAVEIKDPKDPKFNLMLDATGGVDDQSGSATFEGRMNKDAVYFNLQKLILKGGTEIPKEFLDNYVGKWWKIAVPAEILNQFTTALNSANEANMTPQQKQMKQLFDNTNFLKDVVFVDMQDVKGEQSYHYRANLDKDAFFAFVVKVSEIQGKALSAEDKKNLQDASKYYDFKGDVYVGKVSGILNQITGDITLTNLKPEPTGVVHVNMMFWDFDKAVTVEVPKEPTDFPIETLLGTLMGGASMGGMEPLTTGEVLPGSTQSTTSEIKSTTIDNSVNMTVPKK